MTDDYLVQQITAIREEIADLRSGRVSHRLMQVTGTDPVAGLVHGELPDGLEMSAKAQGTQLLPATGDWVRVRMEGATPLYEAAGVNAAAITTRELADGSVTPEKVTQDLVDQLGGATIARQPTQPANPSNGRPAYWWQPAIGGGYQLKQYNYSTGLWDIVQFGNGAIDPNSLIASDVLVEGTVSAELLDAVLVLATALVAGDPLGEHTRIDSDGVTNYATDVDGIPYELGRQGRGWSVRNPITGDVVGSMNEEGDLTVESLATNDPDPMFGGVLLSQRDWDKPWGRVAYSRYPATGGNSALTNTELGFMELGFQAIPGRSYNVIIEGVQPVNVTTPGGWMLRVRNTTDGTAPTLSSTLLRQYNTDGTVDVGWNTMVPQVFMYNGPALGSPELTVRMLFSYAAGTGAAASQGAGIYRDRSIFFWVEDAGPQIPETGDESSGGGTAVSGTPPPAGGTTTKRNYIFEGTANWQRTWNQGGSIIADTEMQQGYADSFNGIRKSSAGWTGLPTLLTGATVTKVELCLESYYWWNMSGGQARVGTHGASAEPAAWPGSSATFGVDFSTRAQMKWVLVNQWADELKSGAIRGISLSAPSTSNLYYGKFRGEGYGSGRPRLRIYYTK